MDNALASVPLHKNFTICRLWRNRIFRNPCKIMVGARGVEPLTSTASRRFWGIDVIARCLLFRAVVSYFVDSAKSDLTDNSPTKRMSTIQKTIRTKGRKKQEDPTPAKAWPFYPSNSSKSSHRRTSAVHMGRSRRETGSGPGTRWHTRTDHSPSTLLEEPENGAHPHKYFL